ncbi:Serine/threonine-protein kinase BCK1/SLK1/SSP31 [Smittium mucronatum]|uniref:Serine/threonine-protein kinase BCK1/SLK1/SSP31 n=1 Tax=Smittium mucronatum TaxID=133383 RepID=A0A1R0GXC8_9FUNG|nr:Serine/threonine-protein kinase BCK1/SLK1/SSP31 [Smittium mucronatum]
MSNLYQKDYSDNVKNLYGSDRGEILNSRLNLAKNSDAKMRSRDFVWSQKEVDDFLANNGFGQLIRDFEELGIEGVSFYRLNHLALQSLRKNLDDNDSKRLLKMISKMYSDNKMEIISRIDPSRLIRTEIPKRKTISGKKSIRSLTISPPPKVSRSKMSDSNTSPYLNSYPIDLKNFQKHKVSIKYPDKHALPIAVEDIKDVQKVPQSSFIIKDLDLNMLYRIKLNRDSKISQHSLDGLGVSENISDPIKAPNLLVDSQVAKVLDTSRASGMDVNSQINSSLYLGSVNQCTNSSEASSRKSLASQPTVIKDDSAVILKDSVPEENYDNESRFVKEKSPNHWFESSARSSTESPNLSFKDLPTTFDSDSDMPLATDQRYKPSKKPFILGERKQVKNMEYQKYNRIKNVIKEKKKPNYTEIKLDSSFNIGLPNVQNSNSLNCNSVNDSKNLDSPLILQRLSNSANTDENPSLDNLTQRNFVKKSKSFFRFPKKENSDQKKSRLRNVKSSNVLSTSNSNSSLNNFKADSSISPIFQKADYLGYYPGKSQQSQITSKVPFNIFDNINEFYNPHSVLAKNCNPNEISTSDPKLNFEPTSGPNSPLRSGYNNMSSNSEVNESDWDLYSKPDHIKPFFKISKSKDLNPTNLSISIPSKYIKATRPQILLDEHLFKPKFTIKKSVPKSDDQNESDNKIPEALKVNEPHKTTITVSPIPPELRNLEPIDPESLQENNRDFHSNKACYSFTPLFTNSKYRKIDLKRLNTNFSKDPRLLDSPQDSVNDMGYNSQEYLDAYKNIINKDHIFNGNLNSFRIGNYENTSISPSYQIDEFNSSISINNEISNQINTLGNHIPEFQSYLKIDFLYARIGFYVTEFSTISVKKATSGDDLINTILTHLLGIASTPNSLLNICLVDSRGDIEAINVSCSQLWEKCVNSTQEKPPRVVVCFGEVSPLDPFLNQDDDSLNHSPSIISDYNVFDKSPGNESNDSPNTHISLFSNSSSPDSSVPSYKKPASITRPQFILREQGGELIDSSPSPASAQKSGNNKNSQIDKSKYNASGLNSDYPKLLGLDSIMDSNTSYLPDDDNFNQYLSENYKSSFKKYLQKLSPENFKFSGDLNGPTINKKIINPSTSSADLDNRVFMDSNLANSKPNNAALDFIPSDLETSDSNLFEKSILKISLSRIQSYRQKHRNSLYIDTKNIFRRRPSGLACDVDISSSGEEVSRNDTENTEISYPVNLNSIQNNREDAPKSISKSKSKSSLKKLTRRNAIANQKNAFDDPKSKRPIISADDPKTSILKKSIFRRSRPRLLERQHSKSTYGRPSMDSITADLDKFFPDHDFDQPVLETIKVPIDIPSSQDPIEIIEEIQSELIDLNSINEKGDSCFGEDDNFIKSAFRQSIDYLFNTYSIGEDFEKSQNPQDRFKSFGSTQEKNYSSSFNEGYIENNPDLKFLNDEFARNSKISQISIFSSREGDMQQGRDPGDSIDSVNPIQEFKGERIFSMKNRTSIKIIGLNDHKATSGILEGGSNLSLDSKGNSVEAAGIKVDFELSRKRSLRSVLRETHKLRQLNVKADIRVQVVQGSDSTHSIYKLENSQDLNGNINSDSFVKDIGFQNFKDDKHIFDNKYSVEVTLQSSEDKENYTETNASVDIKNQNNSFNTDTLWGVRSQELPPSKRKPNLLHTSLDRGGDSLYGLDSFNEVSEGFKNNLELELNPKYGWGDDLISNYSSETPFSLKNLKSNKINEVQLLGNTDSLTSQEFILKRAISLFNKPTPQIKASQDLVDAAVRLTKKDRSLKVKLNAVINEPLDLPVKSSPVIKNRIPLLENLGIKKESGLENIKNESNQTKSSFDQFGLPEEPAKIQWLKGRLIGKGSFGYVYLALNLSNCHVFVVKQIKFPMSRLASEKNQKKKKSMMISQLSSEINLMKDLNHPNIVKYLGFEMTDTLANIFLEYVSGGTINSLIVQHGRIAEPVIHSFLNQILQSLRYLHSKSILHRDIKSANILVEENGTCKLSDFGISKKNDYSRAYDANSRMSMQGSIFWIAPEVIKGSKYSAKVDIWSLGCVFIEMWSGKRPWLGFDTVQTMFKLGAGVCPPIPDDMSPDGLDFCKKCLASNPSNRSTADELLGLEFIRIPENYKYSDYYGH